MLTEHAPSAVKEEEQVCGRSSGEHVLTLLQGGRQRMLL
jgi:hypothetical protein